MQTYFIQLLNYIPDDGKVRFLHIDNIETLEADLELIKNGSKPSVTGFLPCFKPYRSKRHNSLDIFQATAWQHRLTQLGVECQIVEVDYSEEP